MNASIDGDRFNELRSGHDGDAEVADILFADDSGERFCRIGFEIAVNDFVFVTAFKYLGKRQQRQRQPMFPARASRIEQKNHDCATCVRTLWKPSAFFSRLMDFSAQSSTGIAYRSEFRRARAMGASMRCAASRTLDRRRTGAAP